MSRTLADSFDYAAARGTAAGGDDGTSDSLWLDLGFPIPSSDARCGEMDRAFPVDLSDDARPGEGPVLEVLAIPDAALDA